MYVYVCGFKMSPEMTMVLLKSTISVNVRLYTLYSYNLNTDYLT